MLRRCFAVVLLLALAHIYEEGGRALAQTRRLPIPAHVRVTGTTVSWSAVDNARGYQLRWRAGNNRWIRANLPASQTQYTIRNLPYDTDHAVQVRALAPRRSDHRASRWSRPLPLRALSPTATHTPTATFTPTNTPTNTNFYANLHADEHPYANQYADAHRDVHADEYSYSHRHLYPQQHADRHATAHHAARAGRVAPG